MEPAAPLLTLRKNWRSEFDEYCVALFTFVNKILHLNETIVTFYSVIFISGIVR